MDGIRVFLGPLEGENLEIQYLRLCPHSKQSAALLLLGMAYRFNSVPPPDGEHREVQGYRFYLMSGHPQRCSDVFGLILPL